MANQAYEIHVKGHLSRDWADWLENMEMCCLENGEMILSGRLADQAALMGILNKLNCLNLAILSVNKKDQQEQAVQNESSNEPNSK